MVARCFIYVLTNMAPPKARNITGKDNNISRETMPFCP
jgi:hypothetical protein